MAIPPLDIHLETIKQNAAIRLNKISTPSPIIQCLPNEWHKYKPPTIFPPIPTNTNSKTCKQKMTSLLKLAKQQNPKCEKITTDIILWAKTTSELGNKIEILHLTCPKDKRKEVAKKYAISVRTHVNEQTILTIYTDGSKTEEGTGTSFIAYHRGCTIVKKELGMGKQAEAFNAKKWALTKCINWAIKYTDKHLQKQINTLNIYIDNTTVVKATYKIKPLSGLSI
jgi:hypothetical protein